MIFDDTYEHEAWNDTDGTRVVLFVDFVRPLRAPARWLNAAVLWAIAFSPFIGDAKRRHNDWEKRFEEMKARARRLSCGFSGGWHGSPAPAMSRRRRYLLRPVTARPIPRPTSSTPPVALSRSRRLGERPSHWRALPESRPQVPSETHRHRDADRAEREQLQRRVALCAVDEGRQDRGEDDQALGVGHADGEALADRGAHAARCERADAEHARELLAVADLRDPQVDQVGGAAQLEYQEDGVGAGDHGAEAERHQHELEREPAAVAEHRRERGAAPERETAADHEQHARARDQDHHVDGDAGTPTGARSAASRSI